MSTITRPGPGAAPASLYVRLLNWGFALFSSTRLVSYVPTMLAIQHGGSSSQQSLLTWATWVGSNCVLAAWLFEHNQRRCNRAIVATAGNAVMSAATVVLIACCR